MKVWVVTEETRFDCNEKEIYGIFVSEENAREFCDVANGKNKLGNQNRTFYDYECFSTIDGYMED